MLEKRPPFRGLFSFLNSKNELNLTFLSSENHQNNPIYTLILSFFKFFLSS